MKSSSNKFLTNPPIRKLGEDCRLGKKGNGVYLVATYICKLHLGGALVEIVETLEGREHVLVELQPQGPKEVVKKLERSFSPVDCGCCH